MSIHGKRVFDEYWGLSENAAAPAAPEAADKEIEQEFNWSDQPAAYDKPPPSYFDAMPSPPGSPATQPSPYSAGSAASAVPDNRYAAPPPSAPGGVRHFDYLSEDRRPRGRGRGAARVIEQLSKPGVDPNEVGTWGLGRARASRARTASNAANPQAPPSPPPYEGDLQKPSVADTYYGGQLPPQAQASAYGQPTPAGVHGQGAEPSQPSQQPGSKSEAAYGQYAPGANVKLRRHAKHPTGKAMVGQPSGKPSQYLPPQYPPLFIVTATIVEIALYIWELIMTTKYSKITFGSNPWLWGGIDTNTLIDLGGKYATRTAHNGEWWRFFTPIFLHVSIPHIGMNLLTQLRVGISLERSYGTVRIAILYFLCGICGNFMSCIFLYNQVQAGASGALFGFTGILLVDLLQNWKIVDKPVKNLIVLIISIIISLAIGLLPGIDNFCHTGGFIMGIVGGFVLLPSLTPKKPGQSFRASRFVTVLITLPLAVGLLVGLGFVFYKVVANGNTSDKWCPWCEEIDCLKSLFGSKWCG